MNSCGMCKEQVKKTHRGNAHEYLAAMDEPRVFRGQQGRGYREQDYRCEVCRAKFTWSSNRNDLAWTLWEG